MDIFPFHMLCMVEETSLSYTDTGLGLAFT